MTFRKLRTLSGLACVGLSLAATSALAQPVPYSALPDWSGLWQMAGGSIWDPATVTPKGGGSGQPGVREHPPYRPEWAAKYEENVKKIEADTFPDPLTFCGLPAGYPRLLNLPDTYEFVLRPEQAWVLTENGPNVMRIYTDGRPHLDPEEIGPTYTGDSVGHWEGDTLVVDTVGLKGEGDVILNRTGLVSSDKLHVSFRARRISPEQLEFQLVFEDPVAFTAPWKVTKRFRKLPKLARAYDYACGENNRNPVDATGKTLTLGPDGKSIDATPSAPAR